MSKVARRPISLIEFAVAAAPLSGESESGDRHVVIPTARGVLVAVVDGLGHGTEAARAAGVAVETLESHAEESVISLVRRCHERMQPTRGAAMSLASFNDHDHTMTWLSVGNVEGTLLRGAFHANLTDENVLMRGGVVGFNLPQLQAIVVPVFHGDILIFATDGVRAEFSADVCRTDPPQRIADDTFRKYSKRNDDALVLVARYSGMPL